MNLIFLVVLCLLYQFAVGGDEQHENKIIDTNELDENDQKLLEDITNDIVRSQVKKALWDKEQIIENKNKALIAQNETLIAQNETLIAQNQTLIAQNETLIAQNKIMKAQDEKLKEQDEILKNSFYNEVQCAFTEIKVTLEEIYPDKQHFIPMNKSYYKFISNVRPYADIYTLLERDFKWIPDYNQGKFATKNFDKYYGIIQNYTKTWLTYFFSEEGQNLAKLIAPINFKENTRKMLLKRFSYSMSRLFVMSCACHHQLLNVLRKQIMNNNTVCLLEHLRNITSDWSCTYEQIKFYNKLSRYVHPHSKELEVIKFGSITHEGYEIIFVVPYTKHNCGIREKDQVALQEDTNEVVPMKYQLLENEK